MIRHESGSDTPNLIKGVSGVPRIYILQIWCMSKKQVFYASCLVIIMCVINIKIEYELYISVPCFVRVCLICIVKNSKIEGQHYKCD